MSDAGTGEDGGAGPGRQDEGDNYSDLAFSYSAPGAVGGSVSPAAAGMDFGSGGTVTSSEANDWNATNNDTGDIMGISSGNSELDLTPNEPKTEPAPVPVSENKAALKKKAKRRSLLGGESSNVYRRSILGS